MECRTDTSLCSGAGVRLEQAASLESAATTDSFLQSYHLARPHLVTSAVLSAVLLMARLAEDADEGVRVAAIRALGEADGEGMRGGGGSR